MLGRTLRRRLFMSPSIAALAVAIAGFFAGAGVASAGPDADHPIELHVVQGYQVLFVHVAGAPDVAFEAFVPTGTVFDGPLGAGRRAHLWNEHGPRGSQLYRTTEEFDAAVLRGGGWANAWTTESGTRYFGSGSRAGWAHVAGALIALVTRPVFDVGERDGLPADATAAADSVSGEEAAFNIMRTHLRQQPLRPASRHENLPRLFFGDYRPGRLVFVVAGDFRAPELAGGRALQAMQALVPPFFPPRDFMGLEANGAQRLPAFARARAEGETSQNILGVDVQGRTGERFLTIEFDASSAQLEGQSAGIEMAFNYLASQAPDSLLAQLRQLGLATSIDARFAKLNNRTLASLTFGLPEAAVARRRELVERVFARLGAMAQGGLDFNQFSFLRNRTAGALQIHARGSADETVRQVVERLADGASAERIARRGIGAGVFEYATRSEFVQAVRTLFAPSGATIATVAPELAAEASATVDQATGRRFRFVIGPDLERSWISAFQRGESSDGPASLSIPIQQVRGVSPDDGLSSPREARVLGTPVARRVELNLDTTATIEANPNVAASVVHLTFALPNLRPMQLAALRVWARAYARDRAAQFEWLEASAVQAWVTVGENDVQIHAEGERLNALAAVAWLGRDFSNYGYRASASALAQGMGALDEQVRMLNREYDPSFQAEQRANRVLRRRGDDPAAAQRALERAVALDPGAIQATVWQALDRADISAGLVGPGWSDVEAQALLRHVRMGWPWSLSSSQRVARARPNLSIASSATLVGRLTGERAPGAFGFARAWTRGPGTSADPDSVAELEVLAGVMRQSARFQATAGRGDSDLLLSLHGPTGDDAASPREVTEGMDELIRSVTAETFSPALLAQIETMRQGLIQMYRTGADASGRASELAALAFDGGSLDWNARMAAALERLRPDDVRRFARAMIGEGRPRLEVRLGAAGDAGPALACAAFEATAVTSMDAARRALRTERR